MSDLKDILAGRYTPLTITVDDKARRFLQHLARIGQQTEEAMAEQLLLQALTLEAQLVSEILEEKEDTNPHQAMNAAPPTEASGLERMPPLPLLTEEELEEAAQNHVKTLGHE